MNLLNGLFTRIQNLNRSFIILIGTLCFIFLPEIFIFYCAFVFYFTRKNIFYGRIDYRFLILPVLFISLETFQEQADFTSFLSFFYGIFIFLFFQYINPYLARFKLKSYLPVFLTGIFLIAFIYITILPISSLFWIGIRSYKASMKFSISNRSVIAKPNALKNEYIYKTMGATGPGTFSFDLQMRAERAQRIVLSIHSPIFKEGYSPPTVCDLTSVWQTCHVSALFTIRSRVSIYIGAFGTWSARGSSIELRSPQITELPEVSFLSRFMDIPRFVGLSFSENAFGSHMAIACLLILIFSVHCQRAFFAAFPMFLCLILSGSRGALVAFMLSLMVFLVMRSRYFKILPFAVVLAFLTIGIVQRNAWNGIVQPTTTQPETGLRSFRVVDQDTSRGRFEIWRLAVKAWLENPQTFLIGTGNLTAAMKANFDARASHFGLSKDTLTHAHNLWLQTAGESGALGLGIMIWLWVWVILKAWRARDASALALLTAIFVINSVDYLFFYAPIHLSFWMAAAGFVAKNDVVT